MAKLIKYKFLSAEINHGTEENPVIEQIFQGKMIECRTQTEYDNNYPTAEKEAVGEIAVTGEFDLEPIEEPTWQDKIEAQVTYNSMMLGTLIEEV